MSDPRWPAELVRVRPSSRLAAHLDRVGRRARRSGVLGEVLLVRGSGRAGKGIGDPDLRPSDVCVQRVRRILGGHGGLLNRRDEFVRRRAGRRCRDRIGRLLRERSARQDPILFGTVASQRTVVDRAEGRRRQDRAVGRALDVCRDRELRVFRRRRREAEGALDRASRVRLRTENRTHSLA